MSSSPFILTVSEADMSPERIMCRLKPEVLGENVNLMINMGFNQSSQE